MKYYPDGVAEGTPEEIAAFKHIDAALAARNKPRPKAIEGPPKPKKVAVQRVQKRAPRLDEAMAQEIVRLAIDRDGIKATDVAEYFEVNKNTAYNRLYTLRQKGLLWLTGDGLFKAEKARQHHAVENGHIAPADSADTP